MAPFWIEPAWSVESFLSLHPRTGVISWSARPNPKTKGKFLSPHKRILRPPRTCAPDCPIHENVCNRPVMTSDIPP